MGRTKKEEEVKEEETKAKAEPISITASFKAYDEVEQVRVKLAFKGEGDTVKEALESLTNIETGEPYPSGLVTLVNVRAKKGSKVIEKALAPHRARAVLENKDVIRFNRLFNGL